MAAGVAKTAWNEWEIARAVSRQTLQRRCLLLVPNCSWTGHECDVLGVTQDLRVIDIEVKISRADLRADARKDKWWRHYRRDALLGRSVRVDPAEPRRWPPKVWKHYYALPADLWQPLLSAALPSPASGVLLLTARRGGVDVHCERRAAPNPDADRLTPAQAVDIARLANLRMWDALCAAPGPRWLDDAELVDLWRTARPPSRETLHGDALAYGRAVLTACGARAPEEDCRA